MNRKNLIIISVIAIICIAVALLMSSKKQPETGLASGQLFLPKLKENLNQVDKIIIQHSGNEAITLTKLGEKWGVAEKSGYKANFSEIRGILTELADAKLFEAKTKKEKKYIQLGVEEVTKEKGSGSRITIHSKGTMLEDVIIGRYKINKGTYLRKANEKQSWLSQSKIIIKSNIIEWLDLDLIQISEGNISSVRYSPIEGTEYQIDRDSNEQSYKVLHNGITSAPKNPRFADNLARLISEMKPTDVAPRESSILKDQIHSSRTYKTFDGITILAICSKLKEDKTAQITFDFVNSETADASDTAKLVEQYKKEISPWVYTIDDSIFGKFNKQLNDIIDVEAEQ